MYVVNVQNFTVYDRYSIADYLISIIYLICFIVKQRNVSHAQADFRVQCSFREN